MSPDVLFVFVPLVFLGVGAALIGFGRRNRLLATASAAWPKAEGTVTGRAVVHRQRPKGGSRWEPTLAYSYEVAGRRHAGSRLAFGSVERVTAAAAETALAPYQVGTRVAVHYDPANPAASTLDTSTRGTATTEILGWMMIALALFVGSFRLLV